MGDFYSRFFCWRFTCKSELSLYKINDEGDFSYKLLMLAEYNFCKENREKIEKTAKNLYEKNAIHLKKTSLLAE